MAFPTWADVIVMAPELATLAGPTQTAILAAVTRQMDASTWGALYFDGAIQLAAHLGTLSKAGPSAPAGPLVSERVGPVGAGYAAPMPSNSPLMATSYGREYMRLGSLLQAARIPELC